MFNDKKNKNKDIDNIYNQNNYEYQYQCDETTFLENKINNLNANINSYNNLRNDKYNDIQIEIV